MSQDTEKQINQLNQKLQSVFEEQDRNQFAIQKQEDSKTKETWDYVACYYPIGNVSTEYNMFFNHEYISEVIFTGYINEDEIKLREDLK